MKSLFLFLILALSSIPCFSESLCDIILQELIPFTTLVGRPLTFERALTYVTSTLPRGDVRDSFIEDTKKYLDFDPSAVNNRSGFIYRRNWISSKFKNNKILWNTIVPKSYDQALNKIFEAIQIVEEQKARPLGRLIVYSNQRKYLQDFLATAQEFVILQDQVFINTPEVSEENLSGRAKTIFNTFKNIFFNLVWFGNYRGLNDLRLNRGLHEIADDSDSLRSQIERHSPEVVLFWYVKHIRNIGAASTLALLAVLIPELTEAYIHEANIERLELSSIRNIDYTYAESIISASNGEIKEMLKESLNKSRGPLRPEEVRFLTDLQRSLDGSH